MRKQLLSVLLVGLLPGLLSACVTQAETVAEHFDRQMKAFAKDCAKTMPRPGSTSCDRLKLTPADPLATEEGRFAHSIKIPNPVPQDSGYKSEMTSEQYFNHLCKTEAGEFVFKTVDNVDGIIQIRPRRKVNYEHSHLYAMEDPYGFEVSESESSYVGTGRYEYYEIAAVVPAEPVWRKDVLHYSMLEIPAQDAKYTRYFGYDGHSLKSLQKLFDSRQKSRYGYTWRGIVRPHDREAGIGGGEIIILDLKTNEVLGVQRGYAKFDIDETSGLNNAGWNKRCPPSQGTAGPHQGFIFKILTPGNQKLPLGGGSNASK